MAEVAGHLSVAELGERFRAAADARSARHVQAIWLLAKGHSPAEVASTTAFGVRWVEKLLARYNAGGPDALGDLRRRNGAKRTKSGHFLIDPGKPPGRNTHSSELMRSSSARSSGPDRGRGEVGRAVAIGDSVLDPVLQRAQPVEAVAVGDVLRAQRLEEVFRHE